jgi:hypothetical protein
MTGWPSPAERRALDAFPQQIGREDLVEHFKLSPADLRFALAHARADEVLRPRSSPATTTVTKSPKPSDRTI